jgi:hypothetical protein
MPWRLAGILALILVAGCNATVDMSARSPLRPWPAYNNDNGGA